VSEGAGRGVQGQGDVDSVNKSNRSLRQRSVSLDIEKSYLGRAYSSHVYGTIPQQTAHAFYHKDLARVYHHHPSHQVVTTSEQSRTRSARAAKPAGAPHALLELLHLDDIGRVDALEDELGNAVALLDLVVRLGVVEEQHLHLAAVVGVDDARARVDEVLGRKAGAGSNTAV
jgi:hypothetical protein